MARNSLYPSFVKITYESGLMPHVMIVPVKAFFSTLQQQWWLEMKGGGAGNLWTTEITNYVNVLKALLQSSSGVFQTAELWTYPDEESDPVFREVMALGISGTGSGTPGAVIQFVMTLRTTEGGIGKVYIMGTNLSSNSKFVPPNWSSNTAINALEDYLIGSTSVVVGRDTSFLQAAIKALTKTNDALRKKNNLT